MSKIKYIILFAAALSLHSCCSSQQFPENLSLENSEWVVRNFGPFYKENDNIPIHYMPDTLPQQGINISFIEGELIGNSPCYQYSGKYFISGTNISFKELSKTSKNCLNPEFDQKFFDILKNVSRFNIFDESLSLYAKGTIESRKNSLYIRLNPITKSQ